METTIVCFGNIWVILGLYRDNGKENGNYYLGIKGLGFRAFGASSFF